jgi:hypothetical protein
MYLFRRGKKPVESDVIISETQTYEPKRQALVFVNFIPVS